LFAILLSLIRTGNLASKAKAYDFQDLISESQFYGIENILINSLSSPSQFELFNLEKFVILHLNGRDTPSAVATTSFGSITSRNDGENGGGEERESEEENEVAELVNEKESPFMRGLRI